MFTPCYWQASTGKPAQCSCKDLGATKRAALIPHLVLVCFQNSYNPCSQRNSQKPLTFPCLSFQQASLLCHSPPQQVQNNELRSKLPKTSAGAEKVGGEPGQLGGVRGLSSCQPRPARHHHPALPAQPWLPQHPNSNLGWKGIKRRSSEVPNHADYPAAGIRAGHSAVVTFQVGGEHSSQEARAEVLGLTPHTTSRAFLGQPPPASSTHSQVIPGRNATFQGEVCF